MQVKVVKLITGEEVVGDLIASDANTITLKNPAKFVMTQQGMGMIPFSPFSKSETFVLKNEHVVCMGEVEEEIYNGWSSQFGSGLVLAGAGSSLKISPNT